VPAASGGTPRHRRVTLRDIARAAGVSVTSASRALHGVTGGARAPSAETAARVRAAAARLGYSRDQLASGLRTRRSRLLGMLVPRLTDYVLATIYEGVEEAAQLAGYRTVVANTHDDPDEQRARAEVMLDHRVEGLIIGDASARGDLLDDLERRGVPFVLVSRRTAAHPAVTGDDLAGGRLVAEHLLERGHERVAVLAGEPYASTGRERTSGFLERWSAAGHTVPAEWVVHGPFDAAGGRRAMQHVLDTPGPPPTAVFAVNDFAAIGAMGALRDAGLRVGRDVALVGYNDVSLAAELPIPLSTVATPNLEMGRTSVQLLLAILEGERPASIRLEPRLRVRASSAAWPEPVASAGAVR
jgi:LacI family transcriptional regulator